MEGEHCQPDAVLERCLKRSLLPACQCSCQENTTVYYINKLKTT